MPSRPHPLPPPPPSTGEPGVSAVLGHLRDPSRLAVLKATGMVEDGGQDPALDRLTRVAARSLRVPVAMVTLTDGVRQHLCSQVGLPEPVASEGPTAFAHSFCQHVVADDAPLTVPDARLDPRVRENPAVEEIGVTAYLGVPLTVDGHVLGALCTFDYVTRAWDRHDLAVLEDLADAVSDVLALRARKADQLVVAALEESVLRSLPDTAVLQLDAELRVTMAEGEGFRAEGWPPEAFVGRRLADTLPADAFAELAPMYRQALAGDTVSFDHVAAHKVWWVQATPRRDRSGRIAGASVVMRDVSDARERERALAEREAQYRLLAENSSDLISLHAPDGRYRYASPAAGELLGIAPEQLVGREFLEFVHPDDRPVAAASHRRLLERAGPATTAYRVRRGDGTIRWVERTASAIRDADDVVVELQCATRDVTARRAAEDARSASEALNATLLAALEEGLIVYGTDGAILACNPSAERILDTPAHDLTGLHAPSIWSRVRDDAGQDVPPAEHPAARVLATGDAQLGIILALHHRGDDHPTWVRVNAVPLRGGDAAIERVLVSLSDITELRDAERRARHRADHDGLTGLPNRALLNRRLHAALDEAHVTGHDVAVLFLDLNRFKVVNDSLGHRSGDRLLVEVAQRLERGLRGSMDTLARFGGDEFVILAPDVAGRRGVERLAERLLAVLQRPFPVDGAEHVVGASLGAVLAPGGRGDPDELVRDADAAMYAAKADPHGGFRLFEPAIHHRAVARLSLEGELRRALREGEFELRYQPVWALPTRDLASAEALLRWRHPRRGLLPPAEFIPVAEQSGLITELGEWVLHSACAELRGWQSSRTPHPARIAVNVSAAQLADPTMAPRLAALLERHGLDPAALELELTESVLMQRDGHTRGTLHALHRLGIALALDDFGTGFSSLSQLKHLPLDAVKIDRSFVSALQAHSTDHAIVHAILGMARALDLRVVAEGVETQHQLTLLERMGCDLAQGYLLGRPGPAHALTARLARAS